MNPSSISRDGSPRRALALLAAVALAVVGGCAKVDARSNPAGQSSVAARLGQDAHQVDKAGAAALAEEYRVIRPAGVDGALPAIPPSETWPAQ